MISTKILGVILAAFAAGAFLASPAPQAIAAVIATDVQCTGCVGTSDLAGNAVTAAKIKDGEVKAAEIATDAVGAAELQGVTKLLFGQCVPTELNGVTLAVETYYDVTCKITGVDTDDSVVVMINTNHLCFDVEQAYVKSSRVVLAQITNDCDLNRAWATGTKLAVIVFDK